MTRDGRRKQHGCRHQETTTREWHASAAVIVVQQILLGWGLGSALWQKLGVLRLRLAWLAGLVMTRGSRRRQHGSRHQETTTREHALSVCVAQHLCMIACLECIRVW
jgi:hypothetical protein